MAYLKHLLNGNTVTIYELGKKEVLIGRRLESNIYIDDPTVSGVHAKLVDKDNNWVLEDLGSTNGVLHKGERIDTLILKNGMNFAIGTHEFQYSTELPTDLDKTLKIKKSWIPGVYYTE